MDGVPGPEHTPKPIAQTHTGETRCNIEPNSSPLTTCLCAPLIGATRKVVVPISRRYCVSVRFHYYLKLMRFLLRRDLQHCCLFGLVQHILRFDGLLGILSPWSHICSIPTTSSRKYLTKPIWGNATQHMHIASGPQTTRVYTIHNTNAKHNIIIIIITQPIRPL